MTAVVSLNHAVRASLHLAYWCSQDKAGATVNDVMISLLMGTIRRQLLAQKALPDGALQV